MTYKPDDTTWMCDECTNVFPEYEEIQEYCGKWLCNNCYDLCLQFDSEAPDVIQD